MFQGSRTPKLRFYIFHFHFFGGSLARKLRLHIFHFLKEVSHESFSFTAASFNFRGRSRTKTYLSCLAPRLRNTSVFLQLEIHKSYWSGCIKVVSVIWHQIFSILALMIFLSNFLFKMTK